VRLLILLKMMLCSTALSSVSVTEHWRKKTRWRVYCLPWLDSFLLRQAEHSSRSFTRPNTFALQTSLEKALYATGVSDASVMPTATRNLFDSESWQTRAHRYGLCPHSGYVTLQNLFRSFEHGFWWDRILIY
jgi:hypothetical protein